MIWHFDKRGCFSIKSAYRLALKYAHSDSPSCSGAPSPWWKKLWALQLRRLNFFVGEPAGKPSPLKAACLKEVLGDSNLCPFYSRVPESTDHALWGCKANSSSWKECPFFSDLDSPHPVDFFDRFVWVFSCCSLKQLLYFVVGSWFAWSCRNLRFHNVTPPHAFDLWSKAICFVDSFLVSFHAPLQVENASRPVTR
ncbi:hypothetical protein ACOSQ3_021969 [Xanthoceras sorbifolium]